jgi:hypothetical protein
VLAERRRWLDAGGRRHADLSAEGEPLLAEFAARCAEWDLAPACGMVDLGGALEPDFLLLSPDAAGSFRLRGACCVFRPVGRLKKSWVTPLVLSMTSFRA